MKTGKYFSLKEVIELTDFSDRQVRNLTEYSLIEVKDHSPKYNLSEVIYCRIAYYLRQECSMQRIRDLINPCNYYDDNLITDENTFIFLDEPEKMHTGKLETPEYRLLMQDKYVNFQQQILYGFDGVDRKNLIVFNLKNIRKYLRQKAEILKLDSIDLKFSKVNQLSSELTV